MTLANLSLGGTGVGHGRLAGAVEDIGLLLLLAYTVPLLILAVATPFALLFVWASRLGHFVAAHL